MPLTNINSDWMAGVSNRWSGIYGGTVGRKMAKIGWNDSSLVPGAEEERLVHTDALPVN